MALKFINIINFVRGVEPRNKELRLGYTTEKQIELLNYYGFDSTFLIQYDALIDQNFLSVLDKANKENTEFGLWLEVVQQLTETVSIKWRGREGFSWDWHVNPGFLIAYYEDEKTKLIDEAFRCFKEKFGYYPKTVGSWLIDSFSMEYMKSKYNVEGFCICREQYGTDGYTLWGGPFNQGYFPSKNNMLVPAADMDNAIKAPVFRMLGTDPIYEYDSKLDSEFNQANADTIYTMEPVWVSGKDENFIKWFCETIFENESINFAYAQLGQENSFGWENMSEGLTKQFEYIKTLKNVNITTLCDTSKAFSEKFSSNPPCAVSADKDWQNGKNQSFVYNSKYYRANIFSDGKNVWFRDIRFYNDEYRDKYLDCPATGNSAEYVIPPIVDGYLWSGDSCRAGLYLSSGQKISEFFGNEIYTLITDSGVKIKFLEDYIEISGFSENFSLCMKYYKTQGLEMSFKENDVIFSFNGFMYSMKTNSMIIPQKSGFEILPKEDLIKISFEKV